MLGLESIEMMIRKKMLQWIAHGDRRGESDLIWRRMRRELENEQSRWGEQIREEWEKLGVGSVKQWCEKVEDRSWLASKIGGRKKKGELAEGVEMGRAMQRSGSNGRVRHQAYGRRRRIVSKL